jgi:CheY-like chemotaxis protein
VQINPDPKNVLVVDDSVDDIMLLKLAARSASQEILFGAVRNGEEAKEYLAGAGRFSDRVRYPYPNLILVDLHMPRHDGFEFLRWLRATPQFKELKAVVWTGSDDQEAIERARVAGASLVARKPENREGFVALIKVIASQTETEG